MKEPVRNIFTLAFLKSYIIIFENVNEDQADISCAVVIFLPVNEDNYNITIKNYDLIDQSININLELNGKFILILMIQLQCYSYNYDKT